VEIGRESKGARRAEGLADSTGARKHAIREDSAARVVVCEAIFYVFSMRGRATLKATAFLLNGAVFLVGIARSQGRLAPPDYLYLGLLFAAPLASWLALVLGYRKAPDPQVVATANAAAMLLNALLLVFVVWLTAHLDPDTRGDEALWLLLLFVAPPINAAAILRDRPRGAT
jgi:hypothetical protein